MKRFIGGEDRNLGTLFPKCLDDYIAEDNPVSVIDAFVDELNPGQLGFTGVEPKETDLLSLDAAEALHLRLPQSGSVQPSS